ncbi:ribonuclease P protein component [Actinoplanes sp. ATCC 53533]|uniref:ribonuclease P protein component n=1 Tax=Actinoplanes sp. ATCC 53533 TaxID=1288362 RepID=UPI000F784D45|nr:ribonuclease P protein component [Actinoplanes sp. ATCC 53533]RSM40486.1 ribonuclease P protein component [Actinoplanes sp. ATCC 53533]
MLATAQRLRRSADFAAAVRGGRRAGRNSVVVHLLIDEPVQASAARAGFVVSKAVGNAVIRNKVRRRLRHLVRSRLADLPDGALLVVRALPASASVSFETLGTDLDAALVAARSPRRRR